VTILLGTVSIALAITAVIIIVNTSSMLHDKDVLITTLQNQVETIEAEKNHLQNQINTLESEYQDYQSTHQYSDSQYWSYVNSHVFSNKEAEEYSFRFYYVTKEQKYDVYSLENDIGTLSWIQEYEEGVFDCSEMSAYLERYLENEGWNAVILVGDSPFSTGRHAWLLVETSEGAYMPVESTTLQVVWWSNPNYDEYFEYEQSFETIFEALEYSETEFDWWN